MIGGGEREARARYPVIRLTLGVVMREIYGERERARKGE